MNTKALHTLEYDKILLQLENYAGSEAGRQLVRDLTPSSDIEAIREMQDENAAACARIRVYGNLSFSGLRDVTASIKRLEIGGTLSIPELLALSELLSCAAKAKAYGRTTSDSANDKPVPRAVRLAAHYTKNQPKQEVKEEDSTDALTPFFSALEPLTPQCRELQRCIISEDQIADDASDGLYHVRKQIHVLEERIRSQLNSILNSSRSMLQETVITMRDGRYCLPVKAEYKSGFAGMVHDQSSTGSTLFIEPQSIVRMNNEIRELQVEEKKEIDKVLLTLSGSLMPFTSEMTQNISLMAHLDFVFAKARLADKMHATKPEFNDRYYINLRDARHPLIDPAHVVPISAYLGDEFSMLIITGPNTGGKTVALKTIGLFQLMGQAGLYIPAEDGSELAVFEEIFADIGDEQSIEQSLSTFSAHMTNTVRILSEADSHSLCLFDELGAGTDPTEGAALAVAILNFLHNMQTRTVATTHYAELKVYALSTPGIENASCEFSVETLRPTYRLLIGIPGKSNAFAISQKLGLPDYIIDDAKGRIESEDIKFEDVISSLEESRVTIEREREEIASYKREIEEYKRRARESSQGVEKGKDKILEKARVEAAQILADAKETADTIVKELRKQEMSGKSTMEAEKTRMQLNQKLRSVQSSMSQQKTKGPAQPLSPKKIHIGDTVHVIPMNLDASVSTLPDKDGNLFVIAGIIRTKVNIRDLELVNVAQVSGPGIEASTARGNKRKSGGNIRMQKSLSISPEVNLIGQTTMEAMPELVKYLDDAYLAHLPSVRVVHGRGTGALKKAVHTQLKKIKYVDTFRLGEYGEGGDGVTIVNFKY